MPMHGFRPEPLDRYAHLQWSEIADLIGEVWADADGPGVAELLGGVRDLVRTPSEWRMTVTGLESDAVDVSVAPSVADAAVEPIAADALEEGKQLAAATADDGQQRAISAQVWSLEELLSLRLERRAWLAAAPEGDALRHVMPWIWRADSSGGRATNRTGEASGYELRLSRYRSRLYSPT